MNGYLVERMDAMDTLRNKMEYLEELRAIAKLGLNYSKDSHDHARYERLLEMSAMRYSDLTGLPSNVVEDALRCELGHITPKVGVNAAVFSGAGQLLMAKRADDKRWELPGGWVDVRETPQEALRRELIEELGLRVEVKEIIDVFGRMPGAFGQVHTSCHLLFYCEQELTTPFSYSDEMLEAGFFGIGQVRDWHRDHAQMAAASEKWWLRRRR